jgi:hypothetical protein
VTLGDGDPPIEVYQGPTARDRGKPSSGTPPAPESYLDSPIIKTESPIVSDREGKSLGNVNRADRIRTCDLLTPSQTRYQTALTQLDVKTSRKQGDFTKP